jgi:hypothetical protein
VATLLLAGFNASSQPTEGQVCLSVPQAAKIQDSLRVLPVVRQEAAAWHTSSRYFQQSADSLRRANALNLDAARASQAAFTGQRALTANETAKASAWEQKARRRGWLNYLLAAAAAGLTYTFITH